MIEKSGNKFKIAIKARVKHGLIYEYMKEHKLTLKKMAKNIGISSSTLGKILHFRWAPSLKGKIVYEKICNFFNCNLSDIVPYELSEKIRDNKEIAKLLQEEQVIYKEIDIEYLPFWQVPKESLVYEPEFDKEIDIKRQITEIIELLTPKERTVIKMIHGIGERAYAFEEVGRYFSVSGERIKQIERRALRKLKLRSKIG